jgi:GH15 family glucan-1,4-alpha-glucosidase
VNPMRSSESCGLRLGVVGNCQVAALVDGYGRLVWLCLPRPDGEPVFGALLTRAGGASEQSVFAVELEAGLRATQQYQRNTAVLETLLEDATGGAVRIIDFCPRFRNHGRMYRPMMLVRLIEPVRGRPVVRLRLRPTTGYGAIPVAGRAASHHVAFHTGALHWRVTTNASITALMEGTPQTLEQPLAFLLGPDETLDSPPAVLARSLLEETRSYWIDWVRTLAIPFEWQNEVIRAAIALKLCTYEDTGAVLAALTTSIPEGPASGRTWDYRYCWLRDSYFVIHALNRLGATRTMEGYLTFIDRLITTSSVTELQPVYGLAGEPELNETIIPAAQGYCGMGPVRVGNQAAMQRQHDVYGALILAATQSFFDERLVNKGDDLLFQRLTRLGERAAADYLRADAGPWEFRGLARVHTFSATMSWAGCDRLARIAAHLGRFDQAAKWRQRADQIRAHILTNAWNERRQTFVGAFGADDLDATVLLLPQLGLLDAHDPRFLSTVDAIGRELRNGSLLYRYRHEDDFGAPQTAFTVCAFWYVDALAAIGRRAEARDHFENLLNYRNAVGLLSEDIDPTSGELWGNFPQTYSLVGLINSAVRLSDSWESAL